MQFKFLALLLLIFGNEESYGGPIYKADDPFTQLDASNFDKTVLNQNHYWIVEFYNRWCGHCIRFASYWKEFARDVQDWKNVVKVAAVDCASLVNVDLCRKYEVTSYPTIKVFGLQAKETDEKYRISIEHSSDHIRWELIKILTTLWKDNVTPTWPHLCSVKAENLPELWQQLSNDTNNILLIIDPPSSYIGQEVILDLSESTHPLLLRAVSNGSLASEMKKLTDLSSLPALLQINKNGEIKLLARKESEDENLRAKFVHVLNPSKIIPTITTKSVNSVHTFTKAATSGITPVFMQDLENALNYSLHQEVGVHETLKGEKLDAFKAYLEALKEYFPGRTAVMNYLNKLFNWIMKQDDEVHVKDMINQMMKMQTEDSYIPPRRDWKGCKGSRPGLRGYPCSLWTLFHTLSVQAMLKYQQGKADRPQDVLLAIKGYVKYFFSCGECSEHFQQMASNLENELINPDDGVLWLWEAHNKVNKRLASDISTNDPLHPKVQFPPATVCPQCHRQKRTSENISWNLPNVLTFLLYFYNKDQIVVEWNMPISLKKREEAIEVFLKKDFSKDRSFSEESSGSWRFRYFNGTDISLCVMLYVVSAMLLMIIYFLFTLRRQRYKMRYPKHFTVYP